ncbi:unnamed protein product [Lactuca virosa]|uniref:Uncharacterized protein n=1 Tax=Lactuca virosa TaxID=75947 RepID=A0AAU9P455_9ASTR|nr:unnamed protein product [Lactuca virosa]
MYNPFKPDVQPHTYTLIKLILSLLRPRLLHLLPLSLADLLLRCISLLHRSPPTGEAIITGKRSRTRTHHQRYSSRQLHLLSFFLCFAQTLHQPPPLCFPTMSLTSKPPSPPAGF